MTTSPLSPVLSVKDLNVRFPTEAGTVHAVRGINFDLMPGKVLGIVGESGSGKSVTSLAAMGLLPASARIEGSIKFEGMELIGLTDKQMCDIRGNGLSMIFQDPLSSLSPVYSIGEQLKDALTIHNRNMSAQAVQARSVELLKLVGIPSPRDRLDSYPHEFSGGMRQRVMIALAIANDPRVLIADEPTTALDVTIQAQVLDVLMRAQDETGAGIVMITHDLGVVAGMADDIVVMYAGQPVETGSAEDIFYRPSMPYTFGLLGAIPHADAATSEPLVPIEGTPPNLIEPPKGCAFAERCPIVADECLTAAPSLQPVNNAHDDHHDVACFKTKIVTMARSPRDIYPMPAISEDRYKDIPREDRPEAIGVENLTKHYPYMKGRLVKRRVGTVKAADGLTFDVRDGECLSIVGESGCGKTTALLEIMEFLPKQEGTIRISGESNKVRRSSADNRKIRRDVQIVFQDPASALDPRFTVYEVIAEPMLNAGMPKNEVKRRVFELLRTVGLQPDHANRFPVQFSGGQRQRIAIARALGLKPRLVVLDEPVSALDVSVQAGVINLLQHLKHDLGIAYLMVAHDLSVVRHISDRIAVMYLGRIVEYGHVDDVFDHPQHPYTQALLSAIPLPDPRKEKTRERIILDGDLPTPLNTPAGCNFASRCQIIKHLPEDLQAKCRDVDPTLESFHNVSQTVACHHVEHLNAFSGAPSPQMMTRKI